VCGADQLPPHPALGGVGPPSPRLAGRGFARRAARWEPHVRKNTASPVHFVAGTTHAHMKRSVVSVPSIDAERGGEIMSKRTRCAPAPRQARQRSGDLMPHRAFTARRGALLCATALAGAMVFAALPAVPALADGGTDGTGGTGGTGGTTSATSDGGNGGDGGVGVQFTTTGASFTNSGTVTGGNGGARGSGDLGATNGSAGAGGAGIVGS